jgi:hypothetical protein
MPSVGMKNKPIALVVTFVLISLAAAEMPSSFYQAIGGMKNQDILCVKNYDAGASVTEAYKDFEHLDKDTKIGSRAMPAWRWPSTPKSSAKLISPGSPWILCLIVWAAILSTATPLRT